MDRKIALLLGRNDAAAELRWCIDYDGGDGDPLGECDVRRIRDALKRHQYEVYVVDKDLTRETEIHQKLKDLTDACGSGDELLFYFSGHGIWEDGKLALVLGNGESLPAAALIRVLGKCHARSKLIILDCCHAAAIRNDWPVERHDLRGLLATTELQLAMQINERKGSVFTHLLCEALIDAEHWRDSGPDGLVDEHGDIRSDRLVNWLRPRIKKIGARYRAERLIPTPTALPADPGGFLVAIVDPSQAKGYPKRLQSSLRDAMRDLGVGATLAATSYEYCWQREDGSLLPRPTVDPSPQQILDTLLDPAHYYFRGNRLKLPLVGFVAHLSKAMQQPRLLESWLDETQRVLPEISIPSADIRESAQVFDLPDGPRRRACLLIEVAPQQVPAETYRVSWDYIDEKGELAIAKKGQPACYRAPGPAVNEAELPKEIIGAIECLASDVSGPDVEVLLPEKLLCDDAFIDRLERVGCRDGVTASPEGSLKDGHLAYEHPLALRCWERWKGTAPQTTSFGVDKVRDYWDIRRACLTAAPEAPCLAWIPSGGKTMSNAAELHLTAPKPDDGALALGCRQPPTYETFNSLLRKGVPILLWPRGVGPTKRALTNLKTELVDRCDAEGLGALPRALYRHRRHEAAKNRVTPCRLTLLWDVPDRPQFDQPDYDHAWSEDTPQ